MAAMAMKAPDANDILQKNGIDGLRKAFDAVRPIPDGAEILNRVHAYLGRYVAYPSEHARIAHTLWIAHTHLMEAWDATPRIAFLSPEPASGKSRALEASEPLVPRPVQAINVSPAYLFRKVSDPNGSPTILFDEIDTVFGPKAKDNEDIRGLLNAGHRRGAVAGRCVVKGKRIETEEIPAYCAVALAGLGRLPDTIFSRAVVIRMRKRASDELIQPFRRREAVKIGEPIRDQLAAWAAAILPRVTGVYPEMPKGVEDRAADVWEALLAVADAVGQGWPERARMAAVTLVTEARENTPSLGVRLLSDLHTIFGNLTVMSTKMILNDLLDLEDAPWGEINKGKPLTPRGLADLLDQYQIEPGQVRLLSDSKQVRGYERAWLDDAWRRYVLPSLARSVTSVTSVTTGENSRNDGG
jgi:hypothetical protein